MRRPSNTRRALVLTALAALTLSTAACGMLMHSLMGRDVPEPPASEFGLGPRATAGGAYRATVVPAAPLKVGPLQTVRLTVTDAAGAPVTGATIAIDGGMPQHGHGLPTRPRVTREAEPGTYVVDGVRFNMGGWWEFKVAIAGTAARDSVTFNIRL